MPETPEPSLTASPRKRPSLFSPCNRSDLDEAQGGIRKAFLARLAYTVFGMGVLVAYIALVFGWPFIARFFWPSVIVITASFAVGGAGAWWISRRTLRFYFVKDEPTAEFLIDDDLRREALNIPVRLALVDLALWFSLGTLLSFVMIQGSPEQHVRLVVHALTGAFFAGQLVAILEYYAMERMLGKSLYPLLMRGRKVSEVKGVLAVPVYLRIVVLVLTTSVWPMIFLLMLYNVGDATGEILFFLIGLTVATGFWQGFYVTGSVAGPIGRMAGIFERFRLNQDEPDDAQKIYRADPVGRFSEMFDELVGTIGERDFIRSTFGRYVSRQVVDEILNGRVELGGKLQNATVLFADIRGFTTLSEKLHPAEVVELLNEYLENMVQAITAHDGMPDKFIGDGILAVWGVPVACEGHQEKAVRAAFDMLDKLEEMNARRHAAGEDRLQIGIGIHTGELISGNIGSKKKMEFTVIGDTVNTCSRIESANKALGTVLAISEAVYAELPATLREHFKPAPPQQLRGKGEAQTLYAFKSTAGEPLH